MAGTAQIRTSMQLTNGNLQYFNRPSGFNTSFNGTVGPLPGSFTVPTSGVNVDLSGLPEMGGLCRVMNYDDTNFVTYGMFDPVTNYFYPLGEMQPGESWIFRLSRFLGDELGTGAGSGTDIERTGARLRIKADTAPCVVLVEAFNP